MKRKATKAGSRIGLKTGKTYKIKKDTEFDNYYVTTCGVYLLKQNLNHYFENNKSKKTSL